MVIDQRIGISWLLEEIIATRAEDPYQPHRTHLGLAGVRLPFVSSGSDARSLETLWCDSNSLLFRFANKELTIWDVGGSRAGSRSHIRLVFNMTYLCMDLLVVANI